MGCRVIAQREGGEQVTPLIQFAVLLLSSREQCK